MKGSYILIIKIPKKIEIVVGKLGKIEFRSGFYAYVGSAMNGLEGRIKRHLRKSKRNFWHIDYLLEKAEIVEIFVLKSKRKIECEIARNLAKIFTPVKKFGSSDCTCEAHLFYLGVDSPKHLTKAIRKDGEVKNYAPSLIKVDLKSVIIWLVKVTNQREGGRNRKYLHQGLGDS